MPLIQSPSRAAIGQNISELEATGKYPHAQAVAIALDTARKSGAKIPYRKKRGYTAAHERFSVDSGPKFSIPGLSK